MLREVEFKVLIQNKMNSNNFTNLYSPALVRASTSSQLPFTVSSARIEVISNSPLGTDTYVPSFHEDDIIRLLVCETYNFSGGASQKSWQEIFSGRIRNMKSNYGSTNTTILECVGHEEECDWSHLPVGITSASPTDAYLLLEGMLLYGARRILQYSSSYVMPGVTVPSYYATAFQTTMADLISDMEKISGYTWYADVIPTYFTNGTLDEIYLSWKPLSTTETDKYKIIEGTYRYLSSEFTSSIADLITTYKVDGQAPPDTTTTEGNAVTQPAKYTYTATDSAAVANYGNRMLTETYTWIKSNAQAQAVAEGVLLYRKVPVITGSIKIIGTPQAHKGDLVWVDLPSTEVNGAKVKGLFTVNQVNHEISSNGYLTILQVGTIQVRAEDFIGKVAQQVKIMKKNLFGVR